LSAGDLLRAEQNRADSQLGQLIDEHIRHGTIVPVEITCKLIENAMIASDRTTIGFLVDGFPRNHDNLDGWQRSMADKTHVHFVLYFECPEEVCTARCLARGQGRTDDNEESLRKRNHTYINQTMPVIAYYDKLHLVRQICANASADEVYNRIRSVFQQAGFNEK